MNNHLSYQGLYGDVGCLPLLKTPYCNHLSSLHNVNNLSFVEGNAKKETKIERDSQRKKWEIMTQRKTFCVETFCKFIALYQLIFIYITFRWVIVFRPIMPLLFVFYFMVTG